MGKVKLMVTEEWDITWFYLGTLSLVFLGQIVISLLTG
jgi:hypothetical protein